MHRLSNLFLIKQNFTCLHKLFHFDSWNSFIFHTLFYTPKRDRFTILDMSNRIPKKSYASLVESFLNSTLFHVFAQIVLFESWNSFIFHTLVDRPKRDRFNILDMSTRNSKKIYASLVESFLN